MTKYKMWVFGATRSTKLTKEEYQKVLDILRASKGAITIQENNTYTTYPERLINSLIEYEE